jgi:hypothetical protein
VPAALRAGELAPGTARDVCDARRHERSLRDAKTLGRSSSVRRPSGIGGEPLVGQGLLRLRIELGALARQPPGAKPLQLLLADDTTLFHASRKKTNRAS